MDKKLENAYMLHEQFEPARKIDLEIRKAEAIRFKELKDKMIIDETVPDSLIEKLDKLIEFLEDESIDIGRNSKEEFDKIRAEFESELNKYLTKMKVRCKIC